ncbi:MAG: peptide chain release factor N(5)-glutamine methyltransferase [Chitinophagales bacterium]|nr:peptide chain release factor N(5)-glutamine methyltransferase [Chitinophagales bacterium]
MINILAEEFSERESEQLFKYIIEDYFQQNYNLIKQIILNDDQIEDLSYIIQKVCNHYPMQYIFNRADFYGLKFYVDESVLIPRAETEELVHLILKENNDDAKHIIDIGTGSGCIPITLKKHRLNWTVDAIDISTAALTIAEKNASHLETNIDFIHDDILNIKNNYNKYDIIISNPPYIPNKEKTVMSASTIMHEPKLALFVDDDNPLIFYEAIAQFAQHHLNENGIVYVEINEFHANNTIQVFKHQNFKKAEIINDLANKPRIIKAIK